MTCPQNQPAPVIEAPESYLSTFGNETGEFAKELRNCWGERIRTSDWLIQNSVCGKWHATWTSSELWNKNSTDNYGAAGRSFR